MKLGPLDIFVRQHCNGTPCDSWLLLGWHSAKSITWRWILTWSAAQGPNRCYFIRVYKYKNGLNFNAGINLKWLGRFSIQTQPTMLYK